MDIVSKKKLPQHFLQETQTGHNKYPTKGENKDGGFTAKVGQHKVDNKWIVPYYANCYSGHSMTTSMLKLAILNGLTPQQQ